MKHIYLNLKRFDIPATYGGVNRIAEMKDWGSFIVNKTQKELKKYPRDKVDFTMFFPEIQLFSASEAKTYDSPIQIGCQGVFWNDVTPGGNFGAYTTSRPAAAMKAAGCQAVIIGHCEERNNLNEILAIAGCKSTATVHKILNQEINCAVKQKLKVLYCVGEKVEEQERWKEIIEEQLKMGLHNIDKSFITIAYEPVWSIGPGKATPNKKYITKIAKFIKEITDGMNVVYGGGLKMNNAAMLASILEIDGGLIALTRFQDEIGYYPEEYLKIISLYMNEEMKGRKDE